MVNYKRISKKIHAHFNHFDIEQSIAQNNKNQTSLDSPAHKEYNFLFDVRRVNEAKVTGTYLQCGRNEAFFRDFFD